MANNKQIPEIRFSGFTDAWEQRKLGEVVRLNGRIGFRGYTEKDIITKAEGGVLTFSPTNIVDNRLTTKCRNTYITRFKYDESPEIKVHNGDILFVKTGSTLGKSAVITGLSEDATLNPQVVVMRVLQGEEKFISSVLITEKILKQVAAAKIGGAVPTLTETKIKDFDITVPQTEKEKQQIGAFFKNLDDLITLHQRECDKLMITKKSMLEKMFPKNNEVVPEIRFSGFTDAWEQRKLGELCKIATGKLDANAMVEDGKYDFYTSGIQKFKIDKFAFEGPAITIAGNGATVGYMHLADDKFNAYQRTYVLCGFIADRYFLYPEIGKMLPKKIANEVRAGSIPYIVMDMLTELEVLLPSNEEQIKIGIFFKNLDDLITLHQRELEKLKNIKKSMLEKMFV